MLMQQPSSTQAVALVPATAMTPQLRTVPFTQLQAGTMPGLQLVSGNTAFTTPGLTVSAGTPTTYYVVPQGGGVSAGLQVAPQVGAGAQGLTAGTGGVTDYDYQVLTAGLGGSFLKFQGFQKFLGDQLNNLLNQNSGLTKDLLIPILLDAAKGYLTSQGFGFLLDPNVEAIIKRLIGKVIDDRMGSQGSNGNQNNGKQTTPSGPTPSVPTGGFTFTVSGTIVLTPAGSGSTPPTKPNGSSPPPSNGGPMPDNLTPDQPGLSPPPPPRGGP
jgi:hypothetical protein